MLQPGVSLYAHKPVYEKIYFIPLNTIYFDMAIIRDKRGFSLIELLVVMVIMAALTAIVIPGYIGFQNKAREASIVATANGSTRELFFWMQSAISQKNVKEVDTNFDGVVNDDDKSDFQLFNDGVVTTYVDNRNAKLHEKSPWFTDIPLWSYDNSILNGRITLLQITNYKVRIVAKNHRGDIFFDQIVDAD